MEWKEDDNVWKVEIKGKALGKKAEMKLKIDGWTGRILKVEDERDDD